MRLGSVDVPIETAAAVLALAVVFAVGVVRRQAMLGLLLGAGAGYVVSTSVVVGALVTVGVCFAVWTRARAVPRTDATIGASPPVQPRERVSIGARIMSSPFVAGAFMAGLLCNIGLTVLGVYPPVARPIRINAWLAGWPWVLGSVVAGFIGGAQLGPARSESAQVVAAFALGWGLGNIFALMMWFIGIGVLLCDAGPACY